MILLLICGVGFATAFVLKLITDNSWLSFATVAVGFAALILLTGPMNTSFLLAAALLAGMFGAAWGVLAAKMLKERRAEQDRTRGELP